VRDSGPPGSSKQGLVAGLLSVRDLNELLDLHHLSVKGLGPETVKPEKREFFIELIERRGQIIGLRDAGHLVAYAVLQHDLLQADDPKELLGLPADARVVKLAGVGVAPGMRGRGLQRRLIDARLAMVPRPFVAVSTAAPGNVVSWTNLISCGFSVRAIQHRYGGHARFLMVRVDPALDAAVAMDQCAGVNVNAFDLPTQQGLLDEGWRGVELGNDPVSILYRRSTLRSHS